MQGRWQRNSGKTAWLVRCAALAVGASLGWTTAALVSTPTSTEGPDDPRRRLHRGMTVPPLPHPLEASCRYPVEDTVDRLQVSAIALGLDRPVALASLPEDPRLFILEEGGRLAILERERSPHRVLLEPSHPGSALKFGSLALRHGRPPRFFLAYIDPSRSSSRIVEVSAMAGDVPADTASLRVVLDIPQAGAAQRAPTLAFGPDGLLYIAISAGDRPDESGGGPLGTILRIDIDDPDSPRNEPKGQGRPEIWAKGLRAPGQLSFDTVMGDLWLTDIGENNHGEIHLVPSSSSELNLGWGSDSHENERSHAPLVTIPGSEGCPLVSGILYRGCRMPSLSGEYFFGDACGKIHSVHLSNSEGAAVVRQRAELPKGDRPRAFGQDADGEMYILSERGGVYRIEPE